MKLFELIEKGICLGSLSSEDLIELFDDTTLTAGVFRAVEEEVVRRIKGGDK